MTTTTARDACDRLDEPAEPLHGRPRPGGGGGDHVLGDRDLRPLDLGEDRLLRRIRDQLLVHGALMRREAGGSGVVNVMPFP
jgi:hypothetical protein